MKMRRERLRILSRGRKGLVTDTVGFLQKRSARLAIEQKLVEEARNTILVASAHGSGLACEFLC